MKRLCLLLAIVGALSVTAAFGQTVIDPAKGFTLQNEYVQYRFEPRGFGLSGMVDRRTGFNHIGEVDGRHLLWEVTFGRGTMRPKIDNNYKPCSYASLLTRPNGDQILVLQWNDMRFWEEDGIVTIRVTIDWRRPKASRPGGSSFKTGRTTGDCGKWPARRSRGSRLRGPTTSRCR